MREVIFATVEFIKKYYADKFDGNDYHHAERVYYIAMELVKTEKANNFLVALAALLHSIDKPADRSNKTCPAARQFLATQKLDQRIIDSVCEIISQVDFKFNRTHARLKTKEAEIVADANMLDAIGAIGIARCFAYGGFHKLEMYDGTITSPNMIKNFYDKLLVVKDFLHTDTAKQVAEDRTKFVDTFLHQFFIEWNYGKKK